MYNDENEKAKELDKNKEQQQNYRLATVTSLFDDGCAKIQFFGEDEPSEKEYPYLTTYQPVVGDNVILLKTSNSYIILGKVVHKVSPTADQDSDEEFEEKLATYLEEHDYVHLWSDGTIMNVSNNYNEFKNLKVTNNFKHTGNYIGFFGHSINSIRRVDQLNSDAGISSTVAKLNSLLTALASYGLIYSS